jgi:hypothetical protein
MTVDDDNLQVSTPTMAMSVQVIPARSQIPAWGGSVGMA